ncbi:sodium:solute symporter family transporter [Kurthia gibsonii]|uniref:sodium:solute symporter family transporter n=1 Tax=Kurthia gibsonii TaxID=33946 RepID=UPI001141F424|nr:hypothetical protein [Kurthia gibsonii]
MSFFLGIVGLTLLVTYITAKKTKNVKKLYTANGSLIGWQNGWAISGDYLSAATFLGAAGAIATTATGLISCIILVQLVRIFGVLQEMLMLLKHLYSH